MSRQHHYLKTETQYWQAVEKGEKKFELRKNDRDYRVGDYLHLEEVVSGIKTGRVWMPLEIKYIHYGDDMYGLKFGHCIINW
jgi:hypothetical protein